MLPLGYAGHPDLRLRVGFRGFLRRVVRGYSASEGFATVRAPAPALPVARVQPCAVTTRVPWAPSCKVGPLVNALSAEGACGLPLAGLCREHVAFRGYGLAYYAPAARPRCG